MTAELAESCVRPGGSQTITIRSEQGSGVGYDTVYSDGNSGAKPGHYGGNKVWIIGESGSWTDTWVVAPQAPAGRTEVKVLASKVGFSYAQTSIFFQLADALGNCAA